MHKAKKKIAERKEYLGRDETGLKLLQDISNSVNELRVKAAAANKTSESAVESRNRMVKERDSAVTEKMEALSSNLIMT